MIDNYCSNVVIVSLLVGLFIYNNTKDNGSMIWNIIGYFILIGLDVLIIALSIILFPFLWKD